MRTFRYTTNCVSSTASAINAMVDQATEITWETFRKHVPVEEVRNTFPAYSYRGEEFDEFGKLTIGFHIKDDYMVGFWKSRYKGVCCYYITHSAIEYIFTEMNNER